LPIYFRSRDIHVEEGIPLKEKSNWIVS